MGAVGERRGGGLLIILTLLVGCCGVIMGRQTVRDNRSVTSDFHQLVGGFGFDPMGEPSESTLDFDPRLEGAHARDAGPVLGGSVFYTPAAHARAVDDCAVAPPRVDEE